MGSQEVAVAFLVAGLALSALEIVTPGFVVLPFGLGAIVAAITGFVGADPMVQAIVFVVASLVFFAAMRPLARRLNESTADSGVGARRLVGATAIVVEAIEERDAGLVRIDRETWRAESNDDRAVPVGTTVDVLEVRGTRVIVAPRSLPAGEVPPTGGSTTGPTPTGEDTP